MRLHVSAFYSTEYTTHKSWAIHPSLRFYLWPFFSTKHAVLFFDNQLNFSSINVFSQDVSLTRSASDRYWQVKWFLLNLSCKTCRPEGKGLRRVRLHPSPSTSQADVIHVDQRFRRHSTERSWWSAPLIIITAGHHDLLQQTQWIIRIFNFISNFALVLNSNIIL